MQMTEGIFLCVGINAFVIVFPRRYCCQVANKLGKIYLTQYPCYGNVVYISISIFRSNFQIITTSCLTLSKHIAIIFAKYIMCPFVLD